MGSVLEDLISTGAAMAWNFECGRCAISYDMSNGYIGAREYVVSQTRYL